ncbi:Uncharacterized protein dnm_019170 [Desulfonema magnum]|uniref:Uncharacterized protein n=1 Tax=Desulfonema magnum TaxID=45655 RepID=A0A975BIU8_9BACT|nr:Uncharacterized protein dnm_019170 [Desulfonema magnum]
MYIFFIYRTTSCGTGRNPAFFIRTGRLPRRKKPGFFAASLFISKCRKIYGSVLIYDLRFVIKKGHLRIRGSGGDKIFLEKGDRDYL